jgi:2-oxoglutarate ferredoxin oxidoreductase subunit alpha
MRKHRMDPRTGQATFAIVQAEDELSALGMALGAGWAGARSMTATSGPGISLMAEFTGLGYWAEVPTVIFDIQRAGPSTGLPTRTSQGDILSTAFLSHGTPGAAAAGLAEELCDVHQAFDRPSGWARLRDVRPRPRMNTWMAAPFDYRPSPDRGNCSTPTRPRGR